MLPFHEERDIVAFLVNAIDKLHARAARAGAR